MIFETDSIHSFLVEEFRRRVRVNARYSLRAYSLSLGISSGALSEILRQRRPLTLKAAKRMAQSMGMDAAETKRLYELVESDRRASMGEISTTRAPGLPVRQKQMDVDTFHVVSEWHHFAILNLFDCEGFRWHAGWIAKRLGLGLSQARLSMELLLRVGLVENRGGKMRCAQDFVLSTAGLSSSAVRSYHRQILGKAESALELQKLDERDISGIGFAFDPKRLTQIRKEISEFQDQLLAKYSKGKRQEVYFLEMALFRLTQGEQDVQG